MKHFSVLFLLMLLCISCDQEKEQSASVPEKEVNQTTEPFTSAKWKKQQEGEFPFRPLMYKEVLYSDSLRTLSKQDIIQLLGAPSREENNHLYYLVERTRMGTWTVKQKSLVFKFNQQDSVEWIKLHE